MKLLVTGGAGFIGSHFIRLRIRHRPNDHIINLDKLTYAGNLDNLRDVEGHPNYRFVQGDICNAATVMPLAEETNVTINFAAETHVDRSILEPEQFIQTDVYGTHVLLEAARRYKHERFIQISTDEVYGSIETGAFTEDSPLHPNSPYAASKAAGDLLVQSYVRTYGVPAVITRSSNNFGSHQHPEKMIPLFITNAIEHKPLPLYGDGLHVRDWIDVEENCAAIDLVLHRGEVGQVYNIGGGNERTNVEIARLIVKELSQSDRLIQCVKDRRAHDRRYALDCRKIAALGFKPKRAFQESLLTTIRWYKEHSAWWQAIKPGKSG
jgi:dTDP-glucose 4,6-dehydratase